MLPPRTEVTYVLDLLVKAGVDFGSLRPSVTRRIYPLLLTLIAVRVRPARRIDARF